MEYIKTKVLRIIDVTVEVIGEIATMAIIIRIIVVLDVMKNFGKHIPIGRPPLRISLRVLDNGNIQPKR